MRALTRLAMPILVVTLLGGGTSRALDISSCDQSVPANDTGVLQTDLACSAQTGVTLGQGATLQMNGHSITDDLNTLGYLGVYCSGGRCRIEGPGELSMFAIALNMGRGTMELSGLDLHDNVDGAVVGTFRVVANNVNCHDNTECLVARSLRATGFTATGHNTAAITVSKSIRGSDSSGSNNARGGIIPRRFSLTDLTATGNGYPALVASGGGTLTDSTLTGNGMVAGGVDLATEGRPRNQNTTCGQSSDQHGGTRGICTND